ncbi:17567_t:CDS:2, partial [Racocetra persica]
MSQKYESLTNIQKYKFCQYAHDNNKRLTTKIANLDTKQHKPVTFPKLELALKEFVLVYQDQTILTNTLIIEKAKLLANRFNISEDQLKFSNGWLQKFKNYNQAKETTKATTEELPRNQETHTENVNTTNHELDANTTNH